MKKNLKFIMINIVTFIVIALLLFVPMLQLHDLNNDMLFEHKFISGYHFITGLVIENHGAVGLEKYSQVLSSQTLGFVPILMMLSIFVIYKASKANLGKDLVNFLCSVVTLIYVFLLPITASNFITDFYKGYLDFTIIPTFWINVIILVFVVTYYTVVLVKNCVKTYKTTAAIESETTMLTDEAKKEEKDIQ